MKYPTKILKKKQAELDFEFSALENSVFAKSSLTVILAWIDDQEEGNVIGFIDEKNYPKTYRNNWQRERMMKEQKFDYKGNIYTKKSNARRFWPSRSWKN